MYRNSVRSAAILGFARIPYFRPLLAAATVKLEWHGFALYPLPFQDPTWRTSVRSERMLVTRC